MMMYTRKSRPVQAHLWDGDVDALPDWLVNYRDSRGNFPVVDSESGALSVPVVWPPEVVLPPEGEDAVDEIEVPTGTMLVLDGSVPVCMTVEYFSDNYEPCEVSR